MLFPELQNHIKAYDDRRDIVILENKDQATLFTAKYFLQAAEKALSEKDSFSVALSGGSTPKAVYGILASPFYRDMVDWSKMLFFFSDERSVPPNDKDSNYYSALNSGLSELPINKEAVFRMQAEETPELKAKDYEALIEKTLNGAPFDLIMLGMGPDGHTASLFPKTHALHSNEHKVVANFVPKLDTWRMTFTFPLINSGQRIVVLALGPDKAEMVKAILANTLSSDEAPAINVGTPSHKALWILDKDSAAKL